MKQVPIPTIGLMALAILLLLSACSPAISATNTSIPTNKRSAPTITLDNTDPANIDLAITVQIVHHLPPEAPHFIIEPMFYYQQTKIIQFKKGEKLVCGGNNIPADSSSAYISYTLPTQGTVMPCTYISPQGQASFSFTIPEQVKIITPASNAGVIRSEQTSIDIQVAPGCKGLGIRTGYKNTKGGYSVTTVEAPDGCAAQQTINTLSLPQGQGVLGIEDVENEGSIANNDGFHSLDFSIFTETDIPVTWQ